MKTLKESEIRYRRLFEAAQDGILILDAETGLIEDVNPYLIKILGYSREEFMKKKLWEVGAFKDIKASKDAFEELQDKEYIRYENLPLKTKDGQMIEVEFVSNVYLAGGKKVIQCIIRDITEHKRILLALLENEKKYFNLLDQSPDGIFIIDLSGNILAVNKAMCRELEFSEQEFLTMNIWDIIPPRYLDEYKQRLTKILTGQSFEEPGSYEVRGKDGKNHYVEILSTPHYNKNDIVGFQGIAHDITARKQAEDALQKSEAKFHRLVDHLPAVVYMNSISDSSTTLFVSPQIQALTGYTPEEWLADPKFWLKSVHPDDLERVLLQTAHTDLTNEPFEMEYRMMVRNSRLVWVQDQTVLVSDLEGRPQYWQGIMLDITERKRTESALHESEERFRTWIEHSSDVVTVVSPEGVIQYASPSYEHLLGYKPAELIGINGFDLIHPDDLQHAAQIFAENINKPENIASAEFRFRHSDGSWRAFESLGKSYVDRHGQIAMLINARDITERKQAEEELHESEERFKNAFQHSAIGMALVSLEGKWLKVNATLRSMLGYSEDELLTKTFQDITHHDDLSSDLSYRNQLLAGEINSYRMEKRYFHKGGEIVWAVLAVALAKDKAGVPLYFVSQVENITEHKLAEAAAHKSEERLNQVWQATSDAMVLTDPDGIVIAVNPAYLDLFGYTLEQTIGNSFSIIFPEESQEQAVAQYKTIFHTEETPAAFESAIRRADGAVRIIESRASFLTTKWRHTAMLTTIRDITERKQAEEKLISARKFLQSVQDSLLPHIAILDSAGTIVQVNSAWRNFGTQNGLRSAGLCVGLNYLDVCDSVKGLNAEEAPLVAAAIREAINGAKDETKIEYPCHAPDQERWFSAQITSFENEGQTWIVVAHENISQRKQAEQKTLKQLDQLMALSEIEKVVASNFDLNLILSEILKHTSIELGVDATVILLFNPNSKMLEFGAERGFNTRAVRTAHIRLGESYAGRAALERRIVQVSNLQNEPANPLLAALLAAEDFIDYIGVPLITKGQVKGVLEVFHRKPFEPDPEWLAFLNALAGQAAIAIENSMLFESLQRSHLELSLAYDATIEGWSRALDLRDKETEGHTQRVTEMAVKLAKAFGLSDDELLNIRWGSLLHDIGKMGVPDEILLKPGPLTDEEWVKMKKHPTFAFEMLSPIRYLRLALDIPLYHHEKWDGSGYPNGLKGAQIPLAARIFAVVDVWDALNSDRPYRPAWKPEAIREHILASSGTHLDPQVVEVFLQMSN